jgi:hypothetical protein
MGDAQGYTALTPRATRRRRPGLDGASGLQIRSELSPTVFLDISLLFNRAR